MITGFLLSGWQDSNLRPPAPKAGAITGLRYTPNNIVNNLMVSLNQIIIYLAERQGLEPWRRLTVDRLAICCITTLPPLQYFKNLF